MGEAKGRQSGGEREEGEKRQETEREPAPAEQTLHASMPIRSLNLPLGQAVHSYCPPLLVSWKNPIVQTQSDAWPLPPKLEWLPGHIEQLPGPSVSLNVPLRHSRHSLVPRSALNVPLGHAAQALPLAPV